MQGDSGPAAGSFSSSIDDVFSVKGFDTTPTTSIDGPFTPRQLERIADTAAQLQAQWDVPIRRIYVEPDFSAAGCSNDTIHLGTTWCDDEWLAQRERDFRGLLIRPTLEGTIAHEYGHMIEKTLAKRDPEAWRALNAWLDEPVDGVPRIRQGLEAPSPYGSENRYEFVAEAFADVWWNGEEAHRSSKQVVSFYDSLRRESPPTQRSDPVGAV